MRIYDIYGKAICRLRDFKGSYLPYANLSRVVLKNRSFVGVCFKKACLIDANFRDCFFDNSDLRGANFTGSGMKNSYFINADLRGANFTDVDLRFSNFRGARLEGANFRGANLDGAIMEFKYFNFNGSVDNLYYYGHNRKILIGILYHHIDYWLKNYKKLLTHFGYDKDQINEYIKYIKFCQMAG